VFEGDMEWTVAMAFRLLDGEADERNIARVATLIQNPDVAKALERSLQRDAAIPKRQHDRIAGRRR
jgi:hypothetical protein